MLILRIVALALASATAQAADTPGLIAGYHALTDVDSYLNRDLIQKELERIMEDEECNSFADGKTYYNGGGAYLDSIPTYSLVQSAEYKEYIKWAGGNSNFHKQWVKKAFNKINLSLGDMKADFTNGTAFPNDPFDSGQCVGFEESVKKATSYVYNFIEVVQLMQASIESAKGADPLPPCIYQQDSCKTAVKYWDAAVAIYVGSIEGDFGRSSTGGKSNYALANKRCRNFKNCGPERNEGNNKDRISPINTKILAHFSAGQHAAFAGDWALMEDYKKLISAKMVVPWIQGTLRYAWRLSSERSRIGDALTSSIDPLNKNSGAENVDPDLPAQIDLISPPTDDPDYSILDKEVGEAAAFALGAVPKLWACSKKAAREVWPQLAPGQGRAGTGVPVNFQLVKLAFECNYKCLLTSCTEVGSLYDGTRKSGGSFDDADTDEFIDDNVEIRNGAKTCNDAQFGTDPAGYSKCKKTKKSIRKGKCKLLIGGALSIGGNTDPNRDDLAYFAETLP